MALLAHPGKILRDELMEPVGLSAYALAKSLGVPHTCSREVIPHEHHIQEEMFFLTQARPSAFSVTNRFRERKAAGLSNSRTARRAARDDANHGR
jgi:hypothetical protein